MRAKCMSVLLWSGGMVVGMWVVMGCSKDSAARCERNTDCPAEFNVCDQGICHSSLCSNPFCPEGGRCIDGRCYLQVCDTRTCPGPGEICIQDQCTPPACLQKACPSDYLCAADGNCYPKNCKTEFCKGDGEICIDETECEQRNCVGVECQENQQCANGQCLPTSCNQVACPEGQVCDPNSGCVEHSCANVKCPSDEVCANGKCWKKNCPEQPCGTEEVCEQEKCVKKKCVEGRCSCTASTVDKDCGVGTICLNGLCCQSTDPQGESHCADHLDNDCDGEVDCNDFSCNLQSCDDGNQATGGDRCINLFCQGCPSTEQNCADGVDNDCDQLTDCKDPDCDEKYCNDGNTGSHNDICDGTSCVGHAFCLIEEPVCYDGQDNDCDGTTDCLDTDCEGKSCDDGNSSTTNDICTNKVCAGQLICTPGQKCGGSCGACGSWVFSESCNCDVCEDRKQCQAGETSLAPCSNSGQCLLADCVDGCWDTTCDIPNPAKACSPGDQKACGECGTCICKSDCSSYELQCSSDTLSCQETVSARCKCDDYSVNCKLKCTGIKRCVPSGEQCVWGSCGEYCQQCCSVTNDPC